jgi:hypothetical protein
VFRDCDLLLHAGDVTRPAVLEALRDIAPVRAVRGNNDDGPFGESLHEVERLTLEGVRALLVHEARPDRPAAKLKRLLDKDPADLVVHGHSHRPGVSQQGAVVYLNPGSAGPRRFALPRTACVLTVRGRRVVARWWDLGVEPAIPYQEPFAHEF